MTYYLTPTIVAHRRDALSTPRTTAGMCTTDGQGIQIHGSTRPEPWPLTGRLLKTLYPDNTRDYGKRPRWADHPRIEREKGGPTRYVSHPYVLDSAAFQDFQTLEAAGWRVIVTGQSIYYPGNTVRVEIWRDQEGVK